MPKLTEEELETIVHRDLPQRRIIGRGRQSVLPVGAEASAPELDAMQSRLSIDTSPLGRMRVDSRDGSGTVYGTNEGFDDEIVVVELPTDNVNPWKSNGQRKAVVVSGALRRVIGEQG